MLVQIPTLNQFGAQGLVDRDTRGGSGVKCLEQVAWGNERKVMLNLRRPNGLSVGLEAGQVTAHDGGNDRLPPL